MEDINGRYMYAEFIKTANSSAVKPRDLAFVAAKVWKADSSFNAVPRFLTTSGLFNISTIFVTTVDSNTSARLSEVIFDFDFAFDLNSLSIFSGKTL